MCLIKDIEAGQIVATVSETYSPWWIPAGTHGIVSSIKRIDDVYVEFEVPEGKVSDPILCHPIFLCPV